MDKKAVLKISKYIGICIISVTGLWLILSGILFQLSSGMIFKQERSYHVYPLEQNYVQSFLQLDDGTNIDTIYHDNPQSTSVILYIHGNSGRVPHFFTGFEKDFDYYSPANPGFHFSEGSPNTKQIFEMTEKAYDYLLSIGYQENQIIIYGHSLGGPAAVHLASVKPNTKALILVAPVSSVRQICMRTYSILCVFGGGVMNGIEEAKKINPYTPVYEYALPADKTVPYEEQTKLFDAISSDKKNLFELEANTHSLFNIDQTLEKVRN